MSFSSGFTKVSGVLKGLQQAGSETIGDALLLKGLRQSVSGIASKYKGHAKDLLKTQQGRDELGTALGKSAPSILAGAIHAAAAKKVHEVIKKNKPQNQEPYYL